VLVLSLDPEITTPVVFRGDRLELRLGPYRSHGRARDLFRTERDFLAQELGTARPALTHAHWTYEFALAALSTSIPTLVTAHDAPLSVLRYDRTPYRVIRTFMARQVCQRATRMTAVSGYVADHLRRWFGVRDRIAVVPNGLPVSGTLSSWNGRLRAGALVAPVFGTVAAWGRLKNVAKLMRAFAIVRRSLPDATLRLFGSGLELGGPANTWAVQNGIHENIEFIGALPYDSLLLRMPELDILVHPSREEAHPMAIIEAMAHGLPVIGGDRSGGVPETLSGGAGLLTDVTKARLMADAMLQMAQNGVMRKRFGEVGFGRVTMRYSIDAVLASYITEYEALAPGAGSDDDPDPKGRIFT
jgi:L-malate glycosyltransferase